MDGKSVEEMLRARGATGSCPSCGRDDWLSLPDGWTLALPLSDDIGVLPDVIAIGCRQCGFLRLHVDPASAFDRATGR